MELGGATSPRLKPHLTGHRAPSPTYLMPPDNGTPVCGSELPDSARAVGLVLAFGGARYAL